LHSYWLALPRSLYSFSNMIYGRRVTVNIIATIAMNSVGFTFGRDRTRMPLSRRYVPQATNERNGFFSSWIRPRSIVHRWNNRSVPVDRLDFKFSKIVKYDFNDTVGKRRTSYYYYYYCCCTRVETSYLSTKHNIHINSHFTDSPASRRALFSIWYLEYRLFPQSLPRRVIDCVRVILIDEILRFVLT